VTSWQPVDCHAHTTLSDGALPPVQLIERVRARGVRPTISDHISTDIALGIKSVTGTRDYLDELEPLDVFRGGEFCFHDSLWRELPDDVTSRFTHRIGSLHAVRLATGAWVHAFAPRLSEGISLPAYLDGYITTLEWFAREMPVDILAHPTLLTIPVRRLPTEEVWTEELEERVVDALFAAGIAFEISSRYRPHERLVRRAVDRGLRISLGSDGHKPEQVGDIEFSLQMARALGVADADLYDPSVHGRR
jgi:histidinol phosphatase-like PHP family hydrolase